MNQCPQEAAEFRDSRGKRPMWARRGGKKQTEDHHTKPWWPVKEWFTCLKDEEEELRTGNRPC
jgi:hypothetical protein